MPVLLWKYQHNSNTHFIAYAFLFLFFFATTSIRLSAVCILLFSFLASYLCLYASIVSKIPLSHSSHCLYPWELQYMTILLLLLLLLYYCHCGKVMLFVFFHYHIFFLILLFFLPLCLSPILILIFFAQLIDFAKI